jgi:hypothetical protein
MKKTPVINIDLLGISSASLCIIHCLILPLHTVILLGISHNPYIDLMFAIIGLWAITRIVKTAQLTTIIIHLTSIILIFLGILINILIHYHSNLILLGGLGMIVGHIMNFKNHKKKTSVKSLRI